MGRTEIIKTLAERVYGNTSPTALRNAESFCDNLVKIFTESLVNEEKILWKGFLIAEVTERAERQGKDLNSDKIITYPATKTIKCRFSKAIKDAVNKK